LLLAFLIAFFPMVINTVVGLRSVDRDVLRFTRSLSCSPSQLFFKIEAPWALPYLFAGMKISVTLAVIGVVVAELVAGRSGLGYLLLFASSKIDMAFTFAILLVLAALGFLLFGVITLAERRLIYWKT
jgi:NitT/TauT family transport system permease protein